MSPRLSECSVFWPCRSSDQLLFVRYGSPASMCRHNDNLSQRAGFFIVQISTKDHFCRGTVAPWVFHAIVSPIMKAEIHPTYFPKAKAACACGATFTVGSTKEKITVEICRNCHPFYTGTDKIMDTAGRVERFKARVAASATKTVSSKFKKKAEGK